MSAAPSTPSGQELGAGTVKCLFEGWMATISESEVADVTDEHWSLDLGLQKLEIGREAWTFNRKVNLWLTPPRRSPKFYV